MRPGWQWALLAAIALVAALMGWRIVGVMRGDTALDGGRASDALRWRPNNPEALLREAVARLEAGDAPGAEAHARRLLAGSPADGRGYRVLAQVAAQRGERDRARALFQVAARRSPRDLQARAWLAEDALARGDNLAALEQIDRVLVHAPGAGARLFPLLGSLAADPDFADALAARLVRRPAWRSGLLASLAHNASTDPDASDRVLGALQQREALEAGEFDAWIESLMRKGRWGEAHARWASRQLAAGEPVPLLANGDFARDLGGSGFDWRVRRVPGLLPSVERGGSGGSLRLQFMGRRVAAGALVEHAMLLPPGTYRLQWRERTDALRAGAGLRWHVQCVDGSAPVAEAAPADGTRPWRERSLVFTLPASGCVGQWLRLAGSGNAPGGQIISGELHVAAFRLARERVNK